MELGLKSRAVVVTAGSKGIGLAQGQAKVPMRRLAAPEDVADLKVFLVSAKAGYITGAIVPMDGVVNPGL